MLRRLVLDAGDSSGTGVTENASRRGLLRTLAGGGGMLLTCGTRLPNGEGLAGAPRNGITPTAFAIKDTQRCKVLGVGAVC